MNHYIDENDKRIIFNEQITFYRPDAEGDIEVELNSGDGYYVPQLELKQWLDRVGAKEKE